MPANHNTLHSNETKMKISKSKIGSIAWNKGLTKADIRVMKYAQKLIGKKLSEEHKRKVSIGHLGQIPWNKGKTGTCSKETRRKISLSLKGRKLSEETKRKMLGRKVWNEGMIGYNAGEKSHFWQGGISFEPYTIDFNKQFKNKIRARDNQVCMNCGIHREKISRALDVHHINYDKKLSIPENCISLCQKCHAITTTNRPYWTKLFQDKLSKLYDYQYDNSKIILELSK